jgi:hypothetical protein
MLMAVFIAYFSERLGKFYARTGRGSASLEWIYLTLLREFDPIRFSNGTEAP